MELGRSFDSTNLNKSESFDALGKGRPAFSCVLNDFGVKYYTLYIEESGP